MQQKELLKFKKTEQERKPFSFNVNEGSRILFLDGGGMRGLIQIEILEQLEKKTGRKVTELFDWIVGTSTGGIVALGLVYGELLYVVTSPHPHPHPHPHTHTSTHIIHVVHMYTHICGRRT